MYLADYLGLSVIAAGETRCEAVDSIGFSSEPPTHEILLKPHDFREGSDKRRQRRVVDRRGPVRSLRESMEPSILYP